MRRLLVVVAVALLTLGPPAAAAADVDPESAPAPPRVCADALALIDEARPQDAMTLIEAHRENAAAALVTPEAGCADAYDAAVAARETAEALATEAEALAPGGETTSSLPGSWPAAGARAEQALALDEQNDRAATVLRASERPSPTDRAAQAWTSFVDTVKPLGTPLLALLAGIVALGVVARVTVPMTLRWPILSSTERGAAGAAGWVAVASGSALLVWGPASTTTTWSGPDLRTADTATGTVLALASVSAVVTAALVVPRLVDPGARRARTRWWSWTAGTIALVVLLLVALHGTSRGVAGAVVPGLAVAALGVLLVATVLATRLRLTIEVTASTSGDRTSSDDGTGGGHLVALLGELGAEPPRGLEAPRGTDISALSGSALTELPQGAFVKAVVGLVQGLLGSVPWRVTVEEKDPDHLAVVVTRNGRAAGSAVLDRTDLLRLDPADPTSAEAAATVDLYRAAAAVVLVTLSRHHAGFDGLCGATSWRGLALQYVAQSDLAGDKARRTQLLARAVDLDPRNDLAQVALAYDTARHHTVREDLDDYRRWLDDFVARSDGKSGYRSLRLRALYTRAITAANACFAVHRDGSRPTGHLDAVAVDTVRSLLEALAAERAAGREDPLVVSLQDASESMYHQARPFTVSRISSQAAGSAGQPREEVPEGTSADALREAYEHAMGRAPSPLSSGDRRTTTPTGEYNLACTYAILSNPLTDDDAASTTKHLRRAVVLDGLREWLHDDPMLARYRERPTYLVEFGDDPVALLAIEPFARHAGALGSAGLTTEDRILARSVPDLAALLGTTPEEAATVRAAAHLVSDVPAWPGRYDVADVLVSRGVSAVDAPRLGLSEDVARAVRSRVARLRLEPDEREALETGLATWLD